MGQAERQGNRLADDESRRGLFLIITRFRPSLASRKRHLARFAEFVPFTPRRGQDQIAKKNFSCIQRLLIPCF